jgi:3-hydroxybutyryl-CoA dehydrogenase
VGGRKDTEHDLPVGSPVGVVGAGTMGVGVAQCFAQAGHPVVVVDPSPEARSSGPARLRDGVRMAGLLRGRRAAGGDAPADPAALVQFSEKLSDMAPALFVVECAKEKVPVKEEILRELDRVTGPEAVFASCTSAIPITRLGGFTGRPDRVVGTHFMNPAPLKEAVEVIRSQHTSDATLARTVSVLERLGKKPIVVQDAPGFVSNRVLMLTVNEAATVVHQGTADAETVDRVFMDCFGHKMGPLRTADLIGLDTIVDSLDVLLEHTGDDRFVTCPLLTRLVSEGHLGRKSGRGFHQYPANPHASRGGASNV